MAANNKQVDPQHPDIKQSGDNFVRLNDSQPVDQTRKPDHDRKSRLLILLMLLIVSQVIVLLANSGFNNKSPEPVTVTEQPVSQTQIKETEADLREVIKDLNEINNNPDLNDDHIEAKKADIKPVVIPPAPVVVKKDKETIKPKQKISENKEKSLVTKVPAVTAVVPVQAPKPEEVSVEKSIVTEIKPAYIKHDTNGNLLDDHSEKWTCVQDTKNGLMWEVKSEDDAMRNSNNLYSWFVPETTAIKGKSDGGRCKGDADCDTHAYIEAMNKQNYCGHNDWRLPTREQMQTLVNFESGDSRAKINNQYFPQTLPSWYWTSSEHNKKDGYAWYVLFRNGHALSDLKERPKHIRLVRIAMNN